MYVLMCFVNLPKTELPRERVFFAFSKIWKHLINNIRRDFMLSESEKQRSLVYLMKQKNEKIKLNLNF